MSSNSSGSHYNVLERLGKYQPTKCLFSKAGVNYQYNCFDNTANVIGNSVVIEKDYGKISKIVFGSVDKISKNFPPKKTIKPK